MEETTFTQILSKDPTAKDVQLEIFNPIGVTDTEIIEPAPRLKDLHNKRVGLFWNSKARGDVALKTVEALLRERFDGIEFTWFSTDCSTALAPIEIETIEEQKNDAVISTTGD